MAQQSLAAPPLSDFQRFDLIESIDPLLMGGYSVYGSLSATAQPEVVNALQQLQIETEVVAKAIEIFYRIGTTPAEKGSSTAVRYTPRTKSVKGSRKFRCMFYCVFMAYKELGYPVDPAYAAEIVKLPRNEIEQAFTEYCPPGPMLIEPERLLRFYIKRINHLLSPYGIEYNTDVLEREAIKVIDVCRSSEAGREWIQNTAAKIVSIVALYFYMNDIKGFEIAQNIPIFEQACYLSWACIRRYHEQIVRYYNTDSRAPTTSSSILLPFLDGEC